MSGPPPIALTTLPSPLGEVTLAATTRGVVAVSLPGEDTILLRRMLDDLGVVRHDPAALADAAEAVGAYLHGRAGHPDVDLDMALVRGPFRREVLRLLARVPYGRVVRYGELAERAGRPRAARAVGTACATNPLPLVVPCHRVIQGDGRLGGFGGGPTLKVALLRLEGVRVGGEPPRIRV
ncbi:MAG: methylated-DNA--[protein]-cysteine S-methyltransferase [Thermoleophilia bacterium]